MSNSNGRPAALQVDASHSHFGGKRLAIRCLPRVPVAIPDLEQWLDRQLDEFRQRDGQATLRPSRLTSARPNRDIAISWLIELEVPRDKPVPAWDHVASMLRDLRLLGLQPTLLVPPDGALTRGEGAPQ